MDPARQRKNDYSRGYYRGAAKLYRRIEKVLLLAKRYRSMSQNPLSERLCAGCAHWTRGQPGNCKWGQCDRDFEFSAGEGRMWTDDSSAIITTEDFGCNNWVPR